MHFVIVHPHTQVPNKQLALWTMFIPWEPRQFIRIIPGASKDEMIAQFIACSRHWSDILFLVENKEYKPRTLHSIMNAPDAMVHQDGGLHVMGTPDSETLIIRRDALDIMEKAGVNDKWFQRKFDFMEMARRCGCRTAIYDEDYIEQQAVKDAQLQAEEGTPQEDGRGEEIAQQDNVEEGALDSEA